MKNEELGRLSTEEFKDSEKTPVALVMDNIRSLNNVGSAFRTADAFLLEKIYLTGITGQPPHRDIQKTALGATDTVEWEYRESTEELVAALQKEDYKVVAIEQASESIPLQQLQPKANQRYALVFGNEVFGVTDEVVEMADAVVEIPQFGTKHSLNVAVSIGVVVWDIYSKLHFKGNLF